MSGGFANKGPQGGSTLSAAEILWVQTGNAGILLLTEQASSPSASPGIGKIYVKSSDSRPYFMDDSGVEYPLIAGSLAAQTPPEPVDASNTVFTVSGMPLLVVSDSGTYFNGQGYTYAAGQITMDIAPSIFIRYII